MNFDNNLRKVYKKLGTISLVTEIEQSHAYSKRFTKGLGDIMGVDIKQKDVRMHELVYILIKPKENTQEVLSNKLRVLERLKRLSALQIKIKSLFIDDRPPTSSKDEASKAFDKAYGELKSESKTKGLSIIYDFLRNQKGANIFMSTLNNGSDYTLKDFELDVYSIYLYNAFETSLHRNGTNIISLQDMVTGKFFNVSYSSEIARRSGQEVNMFDVSTVETHEGEERVRMYVDNAIDEAGLQQVIKLLSLKDAIYLNNEPFLVAFSKKYLATLRGDIQSIPDKFGYGTL